MSKHKPIYAVEIYLPELARWTRGNVERVFYVREYAIQYLNHIILDYGWDARLRIVGHVR